MEPSDRPHVRTSSAEEKAAHVILGLSIFVDFFSLRKDVLTYLAGGVRNSFSFANYISGCYNFILTKSEAKFSPCWESFYTVNKTLHLFIRNCPCRFFITEIIPKCRVSKGSSSKIKVERFVKFWLYFKLKKWIEKETK